MTGSRQCLRACVRTSLLAGALFCGAAAAAIEIPPSLEPVLSELSSEQREFLVSDGPTEFVSRHELLFERLQRLEPDAARAYVAAMMQLAEDLKYDPERDWDAIPLNTEASTFNIHRVRRPQEFNPAREPGPIDLNRYLGARPNQGPLTFLQAPVAMTPEDLIAGEVHVALVGAAGPDTSQGFRGTAQGPRAMRFGAVSKTTPFSGGEHVSTGVSFFDELNIVDYGDIGVDHLSIERSIDHIREVVREIAETGAIPFIIGGDHSLMYPNAAALTDVYGVGNVGIVHLDAHMDTSPGGAHLLTHGMPIYRLVTEDLVPGRNFIQMGVRGPGYNQAQFDWLREHEVRYHTMAAVEKHGWEFVMERALKEAREGPEYLFISFDVDAIDPTYMPGVGTPEPGGFTVRETLPLTRRLCAETNVVGFELVELNPLADPGYTSVELSDRIIRECLTGIAMRKLGLTDPNYLAPDRYEHGLD